MHRSEAYDRNDCLDCGVEISESRDRAFTIADMGVLCFECALGRGGQYDEDRDRWEKAPNLEGLPLPEAHAERLWK